MCDGAMGDRRRRPAGRARRGARDRACRLTGHRCCYATTDQLCSTGPSTSISYAEAVNAGGGGQHGAPGMGWTVNEIPSTPGSVKTRSSDRSCTVRIQLQDREALPFSVLTRSAAPALYNLVVREVIDGAAHQAHCRFSGHGRTLHRQTPQPQRA